MKNNFGYYISKLLIDGVDVEPAILTFTPGFNVVSGLSNTGKSYAFACINFMLGGKTPKKIPESNSYTEFFLELKTYTGNSYTLFRKISNNYFILKECEIEHYFVTDQEFELKSKHSKVDDKNISSFLLKLCGFESSELKVSAYKKRSLSFRDIAKYILIDEERIITEKSPVYSGQHTDLTAERSIFELLLTGKDAKEIPIIEEPKIYTSKINGQIDFVNSMIEQLSTKISNLNNDNLGESKEKMKTRIEQLRTSLISTTKEVEVLMNSRRDISEQIDDLKSKNIFQNELLERFKLLEEHYISDINRLEFVTEGEIYFDQLIPVKCPLCGGDMDLEHYKCLNENDQKNSNIIESIEIEIQKIKSKLKDLKNTNNEIISEKEKVYNNLIDLEKRFEKEDLKIRENLEPIRSMTRIEIDELLKEQSLLIEKDLLNDQLTNYYDEKNQLEIKLKNKPKAKKEKVETKYDIYKEFCNIIEYLLREWKYENLSTVNFDTDPKIYDIVLNGKNRNANGKGIRAITYSSFVIALMNYCIKFNHSHSKTVVLDSPLTSYRGAEGENEEVNKDMQNSFFEHLSELAKDRQIIIFDNKEPNEDVISKINFINFIEGKGFFPNDPESVSKNF